MKTISLSLNDYKHFIEESLLLTNHRRRGVNFRYQTWRSLKKEMVCSYSHKKILQNTKTNKNVTKCSQNIHANCLDWEAAGKLNPPRLLQWVLDSEQTRMTQSGELLHTSLQRLNDLVLVKLLILLHHLFIKHKHSHLLEEQTIRQELPSASGQPLTVCQLEMVK